MTKSSAQLEREAEQTRSQLAATLEELRGRITPGQLVDQTLDYARESNVGELVRNLGRDARDNPLPLALIGTGLAWMMMTNGRRRAGFDAALADAARSASGALGESPAERAPADCKDASAAGGSLLAFCREHPLVLGGIGVALGALLGAALPAAPAEHSMGGDLRDASAPETSVVPAAPAELVES
jgi:hypothetical protein